jgi:hypothetical protein
MRLFTCQERDFRRIVFELHRPPLWQRVLGISLVTASWMRAIVARRSSFRSSTGFHNIDHDLNDPKRTRQVRRRVPLLDRDALGEVPRLFDVASAELDVVREELEWRCHDEGRTSQATRDEQHVISVRGDLLVTLARDRDHVGAARLASLIPAARRAGRPEPGPRPAPRSTWYLVPVPKLRDIALGLAYEHSSVSARCSSLTPLHQPLRAMGAKARPK